MADPALVRSSTSDRHPFTVDMETGEVRYVAVEAGRKYERSQRLPTHRLRPLVLDWLIDRGSGEVTNTLSKLVDSGLKILQFAEETERETPSPEGYSEFLKWLGRQPGKAVDSTLAEGSRRSIASYVRDFHRWCLEETDLLSAADLEDIEERFSSAFRGFKERERRRRQEESAMVASDDLKRLYHAIALEVEEAEEVLAAGPKAQIKYDPVLPLLPFPLLLGILVALRSGELNGIRLRDIGAVPEHVRVHQANKLPAELPMDPAVQRAWALAVRWQELYRDDLSDADAPALVYRSASARSRWNGKLLQLDSLRIQSHLARFYGKYFERRGLDGTPVLFRILNGSDQPVPFDLPWSKYRHASITEYSRYEKDPALLRIFARHVWHKTTADHYIRNTPEEVRNATLSGLGPFSERVRLRVLARRATPEVMANAESSGALVPGGACEEVLQGTRSCLRANDCRVCKHFLIDPRKRWWFVVDTERLDQRAAQMEQEKGYIREVQNLRGLAAINMAIVQRIDEWEGGLL